MGSGVYARRAAAAGAVTAGGGGAVRRWGRRQRDRSGSAGHAGLGAAVAAGLDQWRDRGAEIEGAGVAGTAGAGTVGAAGG